MNGDAFVNTSGILAESQITVLAFLQNPHKLAAQLRPAFFTGKPTLGRGE